MAQNARQHLSYRVLNFVTPLIQIIGLLFRRETEHCDTSISIAAIYNYQHISHSHMKTNEFIRKQIRLLREKSGFSQSEMAVKLHMDERNYKRIESGEKKTFDIELLDKIATVLDVSIPDLIAESSPTMSSEEIREYYRRIIAEQRQIIDSSRKVQDDLYRLLFDKIKQENSRQQ